MNTDVNDHDIKIDQGEYRMMENMVPAHAGKGLGFARESLKGTEQVSSVDYYSGTKTLGSYEDAPNGKVYFFLYDNIGFHRIMVYDSKTNQVHTILVDSQLKWTVDTQIIGIAVIDNVIYWSDPIPKYFKIQPIEQLIEIDYYVKGWDNDPLFGPTTSYFYFKVSKQFSASIELEFSFTSPITGEALALLLAQNLKNSLAFDNVFEVEPVKTGSTVIKIKAKAITGNWALSNVSGEYYNYYSTNYDPEPVSEEDFYLYPKPPKNKPQIDGVFDNTILVNKILDKNWQFCYRYIYTNNQISVFSPFSFVHSAAKYPDKTTIASTQDNMIRIGLGIDNPEKILKVELAARNSDVGDWFIVKTFTRGELYLSGLLGYPAIIYYFSGIEQQIAVATADAIKQQEGIPRETIDLQLQKNKLFVIENLTGFDTNQDDFTLTATKGTTTGVPFDNERYFKDAGLYNIGIRFFDQQMRTDGTIHKITPVHFEQKPGDPSPYVDLESGKLRVDRQTLEVSMSGKPPEWAYYFIFVRSDELSYELFSQVQVLPHHYVRPKLETEVSDGKHYYMNDNKYIHYDEVTDLTDWRYLHLHLPTNLNFLPEKGMLINFLGVFPTPGMYDQTTILDVVGYMIVVEQPPLTGAQPSISDAQSMFIEIYKPKNIIETNSFYEASDLFEINDPGESSRSFPAGPFNISGDVLFINNNDEQLKWKYDWDNYISEGTDGDDPAKKHIRKDRYTQSNIETYSPSFKSGKFQEIAEETEETITKRVFLGLFKQKYTYESAEFSIDFGYINDSNISSRNLGRPAPLLQNVRQENKPSTIRWSNDYVANASINGLHTFEPLNEYPLPLERGPITKLQVAGEDVMLAIHSSGVTSLYIGKGVIRSADLNPTLVTTEGVIGTDSQLKLSFGTVHPTSVCEVDGNVYFWDGIRNEPVRYGQNGLTPMATTFATRVFFKDTIPATFGNVDDYNVISEFDRLLNMVFFTFISDTEEMTIGYHETSNAWIGKFGFTPEYYGATGDKFLGFVNGRPHLHNQDDTKHNTFYGVYYPSKAKIVINIGGHREKAWEGIMIDSRHKWEVPSIYNEEGQLTSLVAADFVWRDQIYYADFLRDENTDAQLLKSGQIALRHGNFLSSQVLILELELESNEPHYLHSIGIAATFKAGHMLQAQDQSS